MSDENQSRQARLIIPVWGDVYVAKLISVTIPALLAPNNLPALCGEFDVELVLVTESRQFDRIRNSRAFQAGEKVCPIRLIGLDDLMTNRSGDYGMMLTYALFRGFADLGERMTRTYLLFLNTDFILADGSLRQLGKLMRQGKRLIHAPSYRVNLEDVFPQLEARVDPLLGSLAVGPRDMVRVALANRHRTVRARTVNQRLCYQTYQDQFYWYVDEQTLIGYQWPVALIAIMPERVVTEPLMFWDFGFIPEAAPTAEPYFIGDSDEFFMIELQTRSSGQEMIRLGGASLDEIAATLGLYATKEHQQSGQELLTIHAGDLPDNMEEVVAESRAYMAEVVRRLPPPVSHANHPRLGQWFEETKRRLQAEAEMATGATAATVRASFAASTLFAVQKLHCLLCGTQPSVNKFHPLWLDYFPIVQKLDDWHAGGKRRILWVGSFDSAFDAILGRRINPAVLLLASLNGPTPEPAESTESAPYDACLCELNLAEVLSLESLYAKLRPLIKDEGEILVSIKTSKGIFDGAASLLEQAKYPDVDVSDMHFYGTSVTALFRKLALPALRPIPTRTFVRTLLVMLLIIASPLVWLANMLAMRRNSAKFFPTWWAALIYFKISRARTTRGSAKGVAP